MSGVQRLVSRRGEHVEADPRDLRSLKSAVTGLVASLSSYGAAVLGDYENPNGGTNSEMLELLSALYNGEMRPVRRPSEGTDIGQMLPYRPRQLRARCDGIARFGRA